MNVHICVATEPSAQPPFYVRGVLVSLIQRKTARHTHVHLYGIEASDAPCAQVVYAAHLRFVRGYVRNLVLNASGQALLEQLARSLTHKPVSRTDDEQTHDEGGYRVAMDKQVLVLRREYPRNCVTRIDLSQQLPAYCTGLGKALLSTKSEEEIDEYIATVPRTAYTLHTLTDGARLKQDLLAAKEKGYAEDISEISDSLHCVAVPILTPHGGLWAISLSGHCSVIREYGVENIVKHLKKAVWDMTSGYSAAPVA